MARRRVNGRFVSGGSGADQIVVVAPSASPARRSSGGGIRRRRSSGGRKRSRARKGGSGGAIGGRVQATFIGGFLYGQFKKNFGAQVPKLIPGLGTAGTVALGVAVLKPSNKWLQDMGIAAAAIAGASFGETGTVSGSDDDEDEVLRG